MDRLSLEESDWRFVAFVGSLNEVIGHRDRIEPSLLLRWPSCRPRAQKRGVAGRDHGSVAGFGAASIAFTFRGRRAGPMRLF